MSDPVLELLKEKGVYFTISGQDYVTKCFNPDHTDTNPSFRIDRTTGIAHCFSCGFKTNVFKYYGILTNNVSIRIAKLKEKLRILSLVDGEIELPVGAKDYPKPFRGISHATLKHFGAFETDKVEDMEDRIVFPIKDVRDKVICFVGRHILSNGNPRYMNSPPNVSIPMYPTKFEERFTKMVLVEGIFDMLNLYDKGVHNVVCTFGTSKLYNDTAEKLLTYKVAGIEKIYILYDGDEPGNTAANKLLPLIEEAGFLAEIIRCAEDSDPGEMSQEDVNTIREYIK